MTTKRAKAKAKARAPKAPKLDMSIPMRGRAPVKVPAEPPMQTITPAVGPNPDGLTHQTILAHATDDEERAKHAHRLDTRTPNAEKE